MVKLPAIIARYRIASAAILFLTLVLFVIGARRVMEPRYAGKGAREWIDLMAADSGSHKDALAAFQAMGTRAIPYLLEGVRRQEEWTQRVTARLPSEYQDLFGDPRHARSVSLMCIAMLGRIGAAEWEMNERAGKEHYPFASAAVPLMIERVAALGPSGIHRGNLLWVSALGHFGPRATNALPVLRSIQTNATDKFVREYTERAVKMIESGEMRAPFI